MHDVYILEWTETFLILACMMSHYIQRLSQWPTFVEVNSAIICLTKEWNIRITFLWDVTPYSLVCAAALRTSENEIHLHYSWCLPECNSLLYPVPKVWVTSVHWPVWLRFIEALGYGCIWFWRLLIYEDRLWP